MTNDTLDDAAVKRMAEELERGRQKVSERSADASAAARRSYATRAAWLRKRRNSALDRGAK